MTSPTLDKMTIYAGLGAPELCRFDGREAVVFAHVHRPKNVTHSAPATLEFNLQSYLTFFRPTFFCRSDLLQKNVGRKNNWGTLFGVY
jgi:hypothetical protein